MYQSAERENDDDLRFQPLVFFRHIFFFFVSSDNPKQIYIYIYIYVKELNRTAATRGHYDDRNNAFVYRRGGHACPSGWKGVIYEDVEG